MATARLSGPLVSSSTRAADADSPALTEGERKAVREHLDRVLLSPVFRNSKRYSGLLRYVVEAALNGTSDRLKERTIGIEVFGRVPDYDTATDHSVRSAAGEVRKRLAQYYMECGGGCALRVELQAGSYVPQFKFLDAAPTPIAEIEPATGDRPTSFDAGAAGAHRGASPFPARLTALIAIAALPVLGFAFRSAWIGPTAFEQLWSPILSSPSPALICIGGGSASSNPSAAAPMTVGDFDHSPVRRMNVGDAMTLAGLTGVLQANGKQYRVLNRASATSFKDLQQGPFVLIGAMNNEWTLRLMNGLRFTFAGGPSGAYIADQRNPGNTAWSFSHSLPFDQPSRDYAIVSRLRDPRTEQTAMIVAGIGSWGTQAAGEFVTSPAHLKKLEAFAPRGWAQKNLQVVIATDVIAGSSGPPIVVAAHFW